MLNYYVLYIFIQNTFKYKKEDILWKGGFPEIWAENLNANDFYEDYFQTYSLGLAIEES